MAVVGIKPTPYTILGIRKKEATEPLREDFVARLSVKTIYLEEVSSWNKYFYYFKSTQSKDTGICALLLLDFV